ncbi:hypothetical protein M885DRAFT_579974 [Pelagophyceae sp. CCMP2097]|nr:hypothetical protein M885DRAFT_579974 [Pelagophyceae sp. CCMP2097]
MADAAADIDEEMGADEDEEMDLSCRPVGALKATELEYSTVTADTREGGMFILPTFDTKISFDWALWIAASTSPIKPSPPWAVSRLASSGRLPRRGRSPAADLRRLCSPRSLGGVDAISQNTRK